jgi:hypothetical protein
MEIYSNFSFSLAVDDILRGQGADPTIIRNRRPSLIKPAEQALNVGISKVHAVALVEKIKVLEHIHHGIQLANGMRISNPFLTQRLASADELFFAVCTIGSELEEYAYFLANSDPILALALDGLGNAVIEDVSRQVCAREGAQAQSQGLTVSIPFSPGLPEWPVEIGHQTLFSILKPSLVGITLTTSGMMIPKKSISFVTGIGFGIPTEDMCCVCQYRDNCRYQNG